MPQGNLVTMDAVWTTAIVTRNAAGMVFETLYGRDEKLDPKPQMVAGHVVEDNGLRWTMTLRDGLRFHDGTPVLARDCVASLNRWMKRDPIGQTIAERLAFLERELDRLGRSADDVIVRDFGVPGAVEGRMEAVADYYENRQRAEAAQPGSYRPLAAKTL